MSTKEKKIIDIFSKYLPKDAIDKILINGNKVDANLDNNIKKSCILLSSINSFSSIVENLSTVQLVHFLNNYIEFIANQVVEENGFVDIIDSDFIRSIYTSSDSV